MWGGAIECGALEDPWVAPPADAYELTVEPWDAPDEPETVEITFVMGEPVELNGESVDGKTMIKKLNEIGGKHGVGRIDMLEDRLVGFKSRELYECPAAVTLITAHKALETMTLPKQVTTVKKDLEKVYADLTNVGYWFSPLKDGSEQGTSA